MKTFLVLLTLAAFVIVQAGCSAGASVRHNDHRHGVGVTGSSQGPGVSGGVRAY